MTTLPPQVLLLLLLLGATSGLAAALLFLHHGLGSTKPFRPIVPHPSRPASMLVFAALPLFLYFISLLRFPWFVFVPADSLNSPDSLHRLELTPAHVTIEDWDSPSPFAYPHDTADLMLSAARAVTTGPARQRPRAVRDLSWWTGVCPNYSPFTLPILLRSLRDPDPAVQGAAARGIGSIGGNATAAIPGLLAVRGTSVAYFDFLIQEAVYLIEHSPAWPPEEECEDVSMEELERRAGQRDGSAAEPREENAPSG